MGFLNTSDDDPEPEFEKADGSCTTFWTRVHRNDERTHAYVLSVGDQFLARAVDVDEHGEVLVALEIGQFITAEEADEQVRAWVDANPKGIQTNSFFS